MSEFTLHSNIHLPGARALVVWRDKGVEVGRRQVLTYKAGIRGSAGLCRCCFECGLQGCYVVRNGTDRLAANLSCNSLAVDRTHGLAVREGHVATGAYRSTRCHYVEQALWKS